MYEITAACLSNTGLVRSNNEDNFYFNREYMSPDNTGLEVPLVMRERNRNPVVFGVFDGMGGELDGEAASFTAASALSTEVMRRKQQMEADPEGFLLDSALSLNAAVLKEAKNIKSPHMGTTMVEMWIKENMAWVCNVGDSRAYAFRGGTLEQLSVDHVYLSSFHKGKIKPPLTQHLGIDPEDFVIEPSVAGYRLRPGDRFLLCSDGVTDMLTNEQLTGLLADMGDDASTVGKIVDAALAAGGKDNITVIVCTCSSVVV